MNEHGRETDWAHSTQVADGFEAYDDLPERTIGYPAVFCRLHLDSPRVRTVLDYGCGPGKVAARVADNYDIDVLAVDVSTRMLHIARNTRPHPRVDYRLIESAGLPWVPDDSLDAAMSCYVFINIGSIDVIQEVVAEVYRVLRPGAYYGICDTNPDTTGVEFSTFRSGEPRMSYQAGERRTVSLHHPGGTTLELLDYHWPRSTYGEVLANAGFSEIEYATPLLDDVESTEQLTSSDNQSPAEALRPPFLIVSGRK